MSREKQEMLKINGNEISAAAFDVLWESVVPDTPKPSVLHCGAPGDTVDDRGRVIERANADLRAAGYAGPRGPVEDVAVGLGIVARPWLAVDVRLFERAPTVTNPPRKLGARLAVAGTVGVAAVLGPTGFTAWSFPSESLVNEVVRLFVHHEPPFRFAGTAIDPNQLYAPTRRENVEATLRLMEAPFVRRAHICAVTTDHVVGRTRVSTGLTVNDIDAGRFLVFSDRNQIVIIPGNRVTLERKLKEMVGSYRTY